jgi:hypothetical protein
MPIKSPVPMVHAFVVCTRVDRNDATGQYDLIGTRLGYVVPYCPVTVGVAIYAQLSAVRGEYYPEFRLWGPDGDIGWEVRFPNPMTSPNDDPLRRIQLSADNLLLPFPCPGRFDLILLARGSEIARYPLRVELADKTGGTTD